MSLLDSLHPDFNIVAHQPGSTDSDLAALRLSRAAGA